MSAVRLHLLGAPHAWRDEQPVVFRTRKTLALLAYLAAEGGLHPRDKLAALLWPTHEPTDARNDLRTTLVFLRQALGDAAGDALLTTRTALGLAPSASLTVDVQTLAHAASLTRMAYALPAPRAELEHAVTVYQGPFLDRLNVPEAPEFEAWVQQQQARWLRMVSGLLDRLAAVQTEVGDLEAAAGTLERWVALAPDEEGAWERLITLCLEHDDPMGARRAWTACQAALAALDMQPGPSLAATAARLGAAVAARWVAFPASTAGAATRDPLQKAPLIGRSGELAVLRRVYEHVQDVQARDARAQVVVLRGEAGIGKTRLAREFLAWARSQGADVLSGHAFEVEGSLPYAPLVTALRPRLECENAPDDLLSDVWLTELARLLPELRDRYPDLPPASEDTIVGQGNLYEAVTRLGVALATRASLVLFMDDLQWADTGTRDLLHYAVVRWVESGARVLLLLAVRAEDVGTQGMLGQWLSGLEREAPTAALELASLAPAEVVQLVAVLAGEQERTDEVVDFGQWLAKTTGGQPLYVTLVLQALLEEGVVGRRAVAGDGWVLDVARAARAVRTEGRAAVMPAGVRALIMARYARLDATEAGVLAAGAVLGGHFSAARVARVAGIEERAGERVLDQLVRARLLREVPGGAYTVGHDLVREVLYAELGEARRQRLHRQALAVLEAEGAPATELARHALAAGLVEQGVRYSLAAGDAALAVLAVRDALAHYERARALAEAAGPDPERAGAVAAEDLARVYLHLGRAYELAREQAQAEAAYQALRALARRQNLPRAEIGALSHLAMLAARAGEVARARSLLEEALQVAAASGDRPALVEIGTHLADIALADPAAILEALRHGEHALALARELEQPHLVASSLHALMYIMGMLGDWERVAELAEEAGVLYAALDTQSPPEFLAAPRLMLGIPPSARLHNRARQADSLQLLSGAWTLLGKPREAVGAARAALAIRHAQSAAEEHAMAVAFRYNEGHFSAGLIYALVDLGAYAEALRMTEHGVASLRTLETPFLRIWVLDALACVHLALLQRDAARQASEEMLLLSQSLPRPLFSYQANARLCAAYVLSEDWARAHVCAVHATEARMAPAMADLTYHVLTAALLHGGDVALARENLRRMEVDAGANRRLRIPYRRALAVLARWDGALAEAVAYLEDALALATDIGLPGEQWQIAALLAQTYGEQGQTAPAARLRAQAEATLQALAEGLPDPALRAAFLAAAARVPHAPSLPSESYGDRR